MTGSFGGRASQSASAAFLPEAVLALFRPLLREMLATLLGIVAVALVCWLLWGFFLAALIWALGALTIVAATRRVVLWLLP